MGHRRYRVLVEVVPELACCLEDAIRQLLVVRVLLFGDREDLVDVLDGSLYTLSLAFFLTLDD